MCPDSAAARLRWLENGHRVLAMQAVVRDVCGLIAFGVAGKRPLGAMA